ncbi:mucoidy inhibitor MuiA family protein [Cellulophaga baltica]|uniref:mucoidy inhibitor MuiA family protein n=1 Tax=Cellulophaga TaxID=104264 RepID=UPI001C073999|nr:MULTISPECIES: mucoidy inhibitor MuiA family protein [Cellulophaga]MBU2996372.1 mucoidy inhibitor MuiA family protein [Cellulophaga baltica]MDO6767768.1 mucoidy inhibitor MuiA family protein [Cellulophaga sp. 1_MG-2023]
MKNFLLTLLFLPLLIFGAEKTPSKIKEVTVYLNSALVEREATIKLKQGTSEYVFTGLSHKIDESSIQVSGLQSTSILSIAYDINYLNDELEFKNGDELKQHIETLELEIALLKNSILGLNEEEKVIKANRAVQSNSENLDLDKIKSISTYYRKRITEIKNQVYKTNLKINVLNDSIKIIKKQRAEKNNEPLIPKGEITIKFDAPLAAQLDLELKYTVNDAGWIPNYDIKSKKLNDPLSLAYKAHVFQQTGVQWDNVSLILSTGNPKKYTIKPNVSSHYLNFGPRKPVYTQVKKHKYNYNPTVKLVTGIVTDESGSPLPGCNVIVSGTNVGAQTDFDGMYAINVDKGKELSFSTIGFKSESIPIYSSVINTRLEENSEMLEEVVVVGYGTSDISRKVSGSVSGVRIRGNSYVENTPPLYIIDGVPVDNFLEDDLDKNEIQNIEILKDVNATAIYGSRATNGVVVITTKKSTAQDGITSTQFKIKKPYTVVSDGDITAIEINTYKLETKYEFFAAPLINENVFLTASFSDWEKLNLIPGEANIYFDGSYAGKTTIDPYTLKKEMTISLGVDSNVTVSRKQGKNFKSKSFTGSNRILNRTYNLEVKNNKILNIDLVLMDRIPISQNKEIKVDDIITNNAIYDKEKGLLTWKMKLASQQEIKESFSFEVKYPKGKSISL